jgi:Protein of unknown function (DUF3300)
MHIKKLSLHLLISLLVVALIIPPEAMAQNSGNLSKDQIAQLVAPIALYPDDLLAQILMASTYPLEVVEADRWIKQNPGLKGESLDKALIDKNWDVSVKSLCQYPDVLSSMSQNLDMTAQLGDAFLSQQKDVMDTIQELRAQAQAQGNLKTTAQQTVTVDPVDPQVIVIQPANTQVVYVPVYNPTVVYGAWPYPAYQPYSWYYPGAAIAGAAIGFGIGYAVGASWGWSNCNWHGGNVNVNYNRTTNFNTVNINNRTGNQNWQHNVDHRRGVAYRDNATSQRYGQSSARSMESRQARGYGGGTGQQNVQQKRSQTSGMSQQSRQQGQAKQNRGSGGSYSGARSGGQSAFNGAGNGKSERMASQRGQASRSQSYHGGGSRSGSSGSRGGGGGSRGGGGGSRGGGGRGR